MKIQTYKTLSRFLIKTENFLLENEVKNNLFWEVLDSIQKKPISTNWAVNIFKNRKIELSAVITDSEYLLLSDGTGAAVEHLCLYLKQKKRKIKGVSGPRENCLLFSKKWLNGANDLKRGRRDFSIFKSVRKIKKEQKNSENIYSLKEVGKSEWPRARLWSLQFASESSPELNGFEIVNMAKDMMNAQNLFFLQKKGLSSCGMAGLGRKTKNFMVINLVFVPEEHRGKKFARKLISEIIIKANNEFQKETLLFSDYKGEKNLYNAMGMKFVSEYCERMFY